jgi:hypothetical protein
MVPGMAVPGQGGGHPGQPDGGGRTGQYL